MSTESVRLRIEQLRWAYVVALVWNISALILVFMAPWKVAELSMLAVLLMVAIVLHESAFRRILRRPVLWSLVVAIQTTIFVSLSTLGLFTEHILSRATLAFSYLGAWPGWMLAQWLGIVVTFHLFVFLSWCWCGLMWWIVQRANRLQQVLHAHPDHAEPRIREVVPVE